jgi:hypothetical protein
MMNMTDPDEGIIKTTDIQKFVPILGLMEGNDYEFSSQDIKATCHLIMISINKNFPEKARADQLSKFLENRMSAVYSTLNCPVGKLKVKDDFFLSISQTFGTLPKLRSILFFMMMDNQNIPEFATALMLLSHSSMTTIS